MDHNNIKSEISIQIPLYRDRPVANEKKEVTFYFIIVTYNELRWILEKRYSDFENLHNELSKNFSSSSIRSQIPPIPSPWITKTEDHIEKRRSELLSYLQKLLQINEIVSSYPLQSFLGLIQDLSAEIAIDTGARRISLETACSIAQTGDIILFRTASLLSSITRSVLRTDIDHVAVVCSSNWLLEATADGVVKYPLYNRILAWHRSKTVLLLRRLLVNRTSKVLKEVDEFVNAVNGKPYSLSLSKLLKKDDSTLKESYFCSEVVLALYQIMKLIPNHVVTRNYFPSYFASHDVELLNGRLEEPILIDMDIPAISACRTIKNYSSS